MSKKFVDKLGKNASSSQVIMILQAAIVKRALQSQIATVEQKQQSLIAIIVRLWYLVANNNWKQVVDQLLRIRIATAQKNFLRSWQRKLWTWLLSSNCLQELKFLSHCHHVQSMFFLDLWTYKSRRINESRIRPLVRERQEVDEDRSNSISLSHYYYLIEYKDLGVFL